MDNIDLKIIQHLDFNTRTPLTKLAKELKISKKSIEYRIKQLEKQDIIQGYYSVIDIFKLGYLYCRIFLTLKNTSEKEKQEIFDYLKINKQVLWLFELQEEFDLAIVPLVKTPHEFKEIILELRSKFPNYIKKISEDMVTKLYTTEYSYLKDYKKQNLLIYEDTKHEKIDELDTQILRLIAPNARISFVDIAIKLNQLAKTIAYRVKQLEKKGIIQTYRTITNKSKFNLSYYKILMNLGNYTKIDYEKIKQHLLSQKNTIYLVESIGLTYDLDFEVLVKSNEELYELIENLRIKFPKLIEEYKTIPLTKELKTNFFPL